MSPLPARVLGIDPGTRVSGFGVLEVTSRGPRFVAAGAIRGGRSDVPLGRRLSALRGGLQRLIRDHRPDALALETPFVGRSALAALRIGEARGVVLVTAAEEGVPVHEYAPAEVKRSVVGHGGASKPQVAHLVQAWLGLPAPPRPSDAADALGLALCHVQRSGAARGLRAAASLSPVRGRASSGCAS